MPVRWIPGSESCANSYVAGDILVDAGVTPMAVAEFRDRVEWVVLTHCHFDHTAHLAEIARMCDAQVAIHERDAPGLSDDRGSLAMIFGGRSPEIVPDRLLTDGDRIGAFEVLATPGHTPGSICLLHREEPVLISGDTVFTDGGFGRTDFPGGDSAALRASLARLADLRVEELYPGHGMPVTEGGSRHIRAARAVADQWL
ncbi:MAG: MBL fold metallo-hydrolase [Methanomicrobiales archaeon]